MKKLFLASACGLLAAGAASASGPREMSAQGSEAVSKFEQTGEFSTCLPIRSIDSMKILDERLILVKANGGQFYFNQTLSGCEANRRNYRLIYRTSEPTLCRGQIVDVVDSAGVQFGGCSLGDFERVMKKPAEG
jgi:hypothetical protein